MKSVVLHSISKISLEIRIGKIVVVCEAANFNKHQKKTNQIWDWPGSWGPKESAVFYRYFLSQQTWLKSP